MVGRFFIFIVGVWIVGRVKILKENFSGFIF